tara:strand:- start:386 stop:565 length:180 start_codon:yes stop_codon:yes gene_type:complete
MDINVLRGIITAVLLVVFLVGCYVVFRRSSKSVLDEAARLPLEEDDESLAKNTREAGND